MRDNKPVAARVLLYGALLAAVAILLPLARRRIPEAQLRLSGSLSVEEAFSHRKFTLNSGQVQKLAKALDFDGAKSDCVLNGSVWRITNPSNPKFSLTIQEGCDMVFEGWVRARGGPSGADQVMRSLDPEISARMRGAHCVPLEHRIVFHDASGNHTQTIRDSQEASFPPSKVATIMKAVALLGCHAGEFASAIHGTLECEDICETRSATLDLHGADGKILWSKRILPLDLVTPLPAQMSRNDRRIWYTSRDIGNGPAAVALAVDGKERVFAFPRGTFLGNPKLAHNGRYARVDVSPRAGQSFFRFYDLETGKSHDFPSKTIDGLHLSPQLSDDGALEIWKGSAFYMNQTCRNDCVLVHRYQF